MTDPARAVWWIKRDIRIHDNAALTAALDAGYSVLALFIVEPSLCSAAETSAFHVQAWREALRDLKQNLHQRGGYLCVTRGEAVAVLDRLLANNRFETLYSHEETGSNITFQRDQAVENWCRQHGITFTQLPQNGVIRGLVHRDNRQPIISERLFDTEPLPIPDVIPSWQPGGLDTGTFEAAPADSRIRPNQVQAVSETQAWSTLNNFLAVRGKRYSGGISSPNTAFDAGSRLSPHLAWGTVSLRTVFHCTKHRLDTLAPDTSPSAQRWKKSLRALPASYRLYKFSYASHGGQYGLLWPEASVAGDSVSVGKAVP